MKKITVFKKEINVFILNIKNLIEHLTNILKTIRDKILISIINRVVRNFV